MKRYETTAPRETALRCSTILAGDKGIANDVVRIPFGWAVITADGQRVAEFVDSNGPIEAEEVCDAC